MKRLLAIIFALMVLPNTLCAQKIIIGDKMPEMSVRKWLMDTEPTQTEYSCLLFYHSKSYLCEQALDKIKQYVGTYDEKLNLTIITKENYKEVGVSLTQHLKDRIGVAFDDAGRTFRSYGVKFIPFCIISRKNRVVWCGNAATLNDQTISKIITLE